jgi:hypothetical protein
MIWICYEDQSSHTVQDVPVVSKDQSLPTEEQITRALRSSRRTREPMRAPWKRGPSTGEGAAFISLTELKLARMRDLLAITTAGLGLRERWPAMPGAIGLWLWSRPWEGRSGSVSVWDGEEDLTAFLRSPIHLEIMRRYRGMVTVRAVNWASPTGEKSAAWDEAMNRLGQLERS